jgi:hypothetical protein
MSLDPLRYRIGRALLCAGLEILPHGRTRRTIQGCFDSLILDMAEQEARAPVPAKPRVPRWSPEYVRWGHVLGISIATAGVGLEVWSVLGILSAPVGLVVGLGIGLVMDYLWKRAHS